MWHLAAVKVATNRITLASSSFHHKCVWATTSATVSCPAASAMSVWMCAGAHHVGGDRCGPPSVPKCGSLHLHHTCDQMTLLAPILAIKCRLSCTAGAQVIADQRSEGSTEQIVWRKRARVGAAISSHPPIIGVCRHTVKVLHHLSSGPLFALQAISG